MATLCRFTNAFHRLSHLVLQKYGSHNKALIDKRYFHPTLSLNLRKVTETTTGNVTVIEGQVFESPRKEHVIDLKGPKHACALCRLNMEIHYTDVLIISQFVQEDGEIVPRSISGLCYSQHRRMKDLIKKSHRAGLMQTLRPEVFPEEYPQMSDFAWKKYNTYFVEAVDD